MTLSPVSPYLATPFVIMLLCVAILPLLANNWWTHHNNKLKISLLLGLPMALYLVLAGGSNKLLEIMIFEYLPFIILLGSLYTISGGILLTGDLRATPINNSLFLLIGAILASFIGTTGAAMLLIRPFLATNSQRTRKAHSLVFFIILVCNIGGVLTPLGDPPLFLGYLMGVPFVWTFSLWKIWLLTIGILLFVYFILDYLAYRKEPKRAINKDNDNIKPLKLQGTLNFVWLVGIVACLALVNSTVFHFIPTKPDPFQKESYFIFIREIILLILTGVSLLTTKKEIRIKNHFTMLPIQEVTYIFLGIFLTMIPVLLFLEQHTAAIKEIISTPEKFFWASGMLSSFLDNAPAYVTCFMAAGIDPTQLGSNPEMNAILVGISLGSVFMGANTYIGNGPNFMVKSLVEQQKVKMPSFFGYLVYSCLVLLPIFFLLTFFVF